MGGCFARKGSRTASREHAKHRPIRQALALGFVQPVQKNRGNRPVLLAQGCTHRGPFPVSRDPVGISAYQAGCSVGNCAALRSARRDIRQAFPPASAAAFPSSRRFSRLPWPPPPSLPIARPPLARRTWAALARPSQTRASCEVQSAHEITHSRLLLDLAHCRLLHSARRVLPLTAGWSRSPGHRQNVAGKNKGGITHTPPKHPPNTHQ
jgi:hypothetical protein